MSPLFIQCSVRTSLMLEEHFVNPFWGAPQRLLGMLVKAKYVVGKEDTHMQ